MRMAWTVWKVKQHLHEQLEMERTQKYEEIEHTLPPSLRRDYRTDKYYNAPRVADMDQYKAQDVWNPAQSPDAAAPTGVRAPDPMAVGVNV
jgi:hypothetical protein